MPASKNTWNKGLNSDFSKLKSQQDSYLDAKNIRVMTDEGSSTFAIENVRGNKFSFKLPTVNKTYNLDFSGIVGSVFINIDRIDTDDNFTINDVDQKSNEIIATQLNLLIQASTTLYDKQYVKVYYNNDFIVIYDFLPQSEIDAGIFSINITTSPDISTVRTDAVINHTILGWGYYNDNLAIISCDVNSNSENPVGTEGFIWDAKYINQDNTILNSDGDYLNPLYHLKYAGKLDLSRQYAIYKHLKCRYESSEIIRLVWTDWNNNLRTCNIADPQIWATPESVFSYLPGHIPQKSIVSAIIPGGTLPAGKYQYFYQLYTNQGAVSSFSPLSNLINLFPGAGRDFTLPAAIAGAAADNSVQLTISNIDTNYDTIRPGYVVYQTADFPEAFFFDEKEIPDNGTITLIHNGNEDDISINPYSNITNLNRPPEIFKSIDVVRNRLFAANARTTNFDLTDVFDARVYRFKSSGIADLYNSNDTYPTASVIIDIPNDEITIEGNAPVSPIDYTLIPETFDCINPFNQENDAFNIFAGGDWFTNAQYKYKADGTTLGGTGLNISYEFTTQNNVAKTAASTISSWTTSSPYITPGKDITASYTTEFSDTYTYPGGGNIYLDSLKSSLFETLFTGYSRGEVYRFGIVFFDVYGYPSYPLWIGDIKFPFASDDNGAFGLSELNTTFVEAGHNVVLQQLGIIFKLDTNTAQFQSIKDKISGWSYVRLKRNLNDSTRLGTGYIQPCWAGSSVNLLTPFNIPLAPPYLWQNHTWAFSITNSGGTPFDRVRLGTQVLTVPNLLTNSVGDFNAEDYIRFIGRTYDYGSLTRYSSGITSPDFGNIGIYPVFYLASNDYDYHYVDTTPNVTGGIATNSYLGTDNKFEIRGRAYVTTTQAGFKTLTGTIPGLTDPFINLTNALPAEADAEEFTEWGTECSLITLFSTPDTTSAYTGTTLALPMYLISYERYLIEQYRGKTRADRYNNEYILTNHFMPYPYDSGIGTVVTNSVFGGDTYVNYFDWQRSNLNFSDGSGYPDGGVSAQYQALGLAVFFPAEVIYNSELNTSQQHASVRQNTDSIRIANYTYNPAFSQQNTTNVFVSKGFLQTNVKEEPHTIYGSNAKIDNERTDAWRSIFINDSLSVNGNYGEINRIVQFKDKLFYYQNDAVGIAAVDERVLTNEGSPEQTQLGVGGVLQRFDYISTETGCKHSFAVESTGSSLYHYDSFINKLFKYSVGKTKEDISGMNPLTDVKGLSGFFRTAFVGSTIKSEDKILRIGSRVGIVSGFNSEYNTIYFTFFDELNQIRYTISYNELLDSFESFYDFYPSMYLNMRKRFLSIDPNNTSSSYIHNLGLRNNFYGSWFPSSVKFRVNENSDFVKTFDNFQINTEVIINNLQAARTVTSYSISNDYQIIPETNSNFVQKIRSWRMVIPRDETNPLLTIKPRISDKYMDVTFNYEDSNLGLGDDIFRLHDVITEYSMRSKITPR
jgi:hypothetical protein